MQRVGGRVNAIGQQARDALKIKTERGSGTRPAPGCSERSQDYPSHHELGQSESRLATQSPATFLGFAPKVQPGEDENMLYGRIRKTQRKPQEEVRTGRKEVSPNLQFTSYPCPLKGKPADQKDGVQVVRKAES